MLCFDNSLQVDNIKYVYAIGNIDYNKINVNDIADFIMMIKNMIVEKNVKRYSTILLKSLDAYSDNTVLRVSGIIVSDESLLKMEELMKDNPTEQELIKRLDENFPQE